MIVLVLSLGVIFSVVALHSELLSHLFFCVCWLYCVGWAGCECISLTDGFFLLLVIAKVVRKFS